MLASSPMSNASGTAHSNGIASSAASASTGPSSATSASSVNAPPETVKYSTNTSPRSRRRGVDFSAGLSVTAGRAKRGSQAWGAEQDAAHGIVTKAWGGRRGIVRDGRRLNSARATYAIRSSTSAGVSAVIGDFRNSRALRVAIMSAAHAVAAPTCIASSKSFS